LFDELKLDPARIYQSVFGGNADVPEDIEAIDVLKRTFAKYGITAEVGPKTTGKGEDGPGVPCDFATQRIFQYSDKNRWQRGNVIGEVGGPDTETFYDTGRTHDTAYGEHCHPNCDCGRFIEIGNSVFMQYVLSENGRQKLDRVNVDFGGGLERVTMAVAATDNVFLTDIFQPYIQYLEKNYGVLYADNSKNIEVIVDHARAMTFLMMDGCMISNKDQGYFLRRLIRRVLTKLYVMAVPSKVLVELVDLVIETLGGIYPMMVEKSEEIRSMLQKEESAFSKNLDKGMKHFEKMTATATAITAEDAFLLQTTYGFPIDVIEELCQERSISVDIPGYHALVQAHKDISRQ